MSTIRRIVLADFERLLKRWEPRRKIKAVHLHCTGRPRLADFRGQATIEAMRTYHMRQGLSDIAQHLTVDPAGGLWTGRSWDWPPASVRGHNGTAKKGPFMIQVVGNFDPGLDLLQDAQRQAVLGAIAAVLKQAKLDAAALIFHRDLLKTDSDSDSEPNTCPGKSLDGDQLRSEVAALLKGGAPALPLPAASDAVLATAEVRAWFPAPGARGSEEPPEEAVEPDFAEVPEGEWMLAEQEALAARIDTGQETARRAPVPADAPLRRHVINLSKGLLSKTGDIDSVTVSPRTIVDKHLVDYIQSRRAQGKPAHLLFYAHGGLVNEASAICYARTVLPWWLRNGVFPIFFIWESGLFETLRQTPRVARGFTDFTDWLLEGITQHAARRVWAEMKDDAANASKPALPQFQGQSGGAWQLAQLLLPVLARHPDVRLHAVGHSTGPILLSKFLPLLTTNRHIIRTLSYLAPAIRTDRFLTDVKPLIVRDKVIEELCMYTMTEEAEREDTCKKIYRKSLLYFVRQACEDRDKGRILGLQKDLYGNNELMQLFGLKPKKQISNPIQARNPPFTVEFSPAAGSPVMNPKTRSLQHGGFDNDADTMVSVLKRVLGQDEITRDMQFPSAQEFKACGLTDATRAAPLEADDGKDYGGCCCRCRCCPGQSGGSDDEDGRDGFGDDAESGGDVVDDAGGDSPAPSPPPRDGGGGGDGGTGGGSGGGGRRAVCIGIDDYPDRPLAGCVADSDRWAQSLSQCGFRVDVLRNAQATRAAMHEALTTLIGGASPGDELVFQYSGHGAQVPDTGGDEGEGFDEAFVPIDYSNGQLLIDDDLREITRTLPAGASLTLFMDCCHSGTISRAALLGPRAESGGDRQRLITLNRDTVERYVALRGGTGKPARARASASPGRGVAHFAACLDSEYAWESGGQGDFTRAALAVFDTAVREGWSNERFIAEAIAQLGTPLRQHPRLWHPEQGLAKRKLLGGR